MPAPSPYTPPHPIEPPLQQTPRLSFAHRVATPPAARRFSSPDSGREEQPSETPVASRRNRFSSATTARRQLYRSESPEASTSRAEGDSTTGGQGDSNLDEDLRDPEFFIKLFSQIDGPLLYSDIGLRESLLQKLERYLLKVNLVQEDSTSMPGTSKDAKAGPSNVNFAEAALVVQGSTRIYGKKVDLLFNAAVQLFKLLSTPFEEREEEGEDEEAGPADTPRATKSSKKLRLGIENRDLAEDIALVDSMKEGGRIEQKKNSRPRFSELIRNISSMPPRGSVRFLPPNIPRLVRKTKTLGTNEKEVEKINCRRVPQYGQGMESRGFIDEYRLNEVLRKSDYMLVEHFVPEAEIIKCIVESLTPSKTLHPSQCDSGIDSCPSSVYNPGEGGDSIIWEGSSIGVCGETDVLSCNDDGFLSEGVHEEALSEIEEECESELRKECATVSSQKDSDPKVVEPPVCDTEGESDLGVSEMERSGTESSGVFSEQGALDESQGESAIEEESLSQSKEINGNRVEEESVGHTETNEEVASAEINEEGASEEINREACGEKLIENERGEDITEKDCDNLHSSPSVSKLKEVEFTPTPRRNKRKVKNFKLPCKLSLLLPEKKKRMARNSRAAELWRPSQSPCSSTSSHYPQSPMSFAPASPDPHSLGQMLLLSDDQNEDLDNLSESDNEGEYFDTPSDGQPQVNYWIQNHQKDLMSAGQPTTLSDQVAQWQELIMPRLEANLRFGPYSHLRYAPVLMELVTRSGWPPPGNPSSCSETEECVDLCDEEDEFVLDRIPSQARCSSLPEDTECPFVLPYDSDFMVPEEAELNFDGEEFRGFQAPKRLRRRGCSLVEGALKRDLSGGHLFTSLAKVYNWGLTEAESEIADSERELRQWASEKRQWLQSKVRSSGLQRSWDEWTEENDNIETNTELDVQLPSGSSSQHTEPVLFTTVFSGFRKEEVSRLLFTALHLASQGVLEVSSEPGVINSIKLNLPNDRLATESSSRNKT
ncbi:uncharacterized protein LOC124170549 [Ischnura elegans]|uniref:uncharacterized protein LOC124170549 n=1 Tax=Ischnura elegans TaxID=197161 RepID=UPI001ED888D8|nr:uncharacterized protein LOC124170549 [Ischnura elegans]